MARLDALTVIRNKNAFSEYSGLLNSKIQNLRDGIRFGIVMCDVNDLKKINDTRGFVLIDGNGNPEYFGGIIITS